MMVERPHINRDLSDIERRLAGAIWIGRVYDVRYDPPRARVLYGDDDFWPSIHKNPVEPVQEVTNWLPWLTARAGNDRDWTPPEEGEQVVVISPSGDREQGIILGALYSPSASDGHVPTPPPASGDDARNWRVWWHRVVPKTEHWIAKAERILRGGSVDQYRKDRDGVQTSAPTYERREIIRPETKAVLEYLAQATCDGGAAKTTVQAAGLGAGNTADLLLQAATMGPGSAATVRMEAVGGEAHDPQDPAPTDLAPGSSRGGGGPATMIQRTETPGAAEHLVTVKGASAHFRLEVTDGGQTSYIDITPGNIVISSPRIDFNPDR